MNTFKGPFRIVLEDLRTQFYIISSITVVLSIFYVLLGVFATDDGLFNAGASFGPFYGLLLFYPFFFFNHSYQYTLALGGTRKQFMMAIFSNGVLLITSGMFIVNGLYMLNEFLVHQGYSMATIFHMADLTGTSNSFLYFWVDIVWGIFLFGLGTFMSSLWFYFGTFRTMIIATIAVLGIITYVTFGNLSSFFTFFITNHLSFVHIAGGAGLFFLLLSYLLMQNGPLERGGGSRLFGKQPQSE